ncbi:MAG: hypothetical protein Q9164_006625 [Protoblastenia rupestris]
MSLEIPSTYRSPIFTLFVGPDKQELSMHESVLARSPVLKGMCTPRFQEGCDRVMVFPEEIKSVFGALLDYLYTNDFTLVDSEGSADDRAEEVAAIYVIAEKYQVPDLKIPIACKFCEEAFPGLLMGVARRIYDNVPESDHIFRTSFRMALRHFLEHKSMSPIAEEQIDQAVMGGGQMVLDIFRAQRKVSAQRPAPWTRKSWSSTAWKETRDEWETVLAKEAWQEGVQHGMKTPIEPSLVDGAEGHA